MNREAKKSGIREQTRLDSWLSSAMGGYCGRTVDGPDDCDYDLEGSFSLSHVNSTNWHAAVSACISFCAACAQCNFVSVSLVYRDCSWFNECDLQHLHVDIKGFRSGAVVGMDSRAGPTKESPQGLIERPFSGPLLLAIGVLLAPSSTLRPNSSRESRLRHQSWASRQPDAIAWQYVTSNPSWRHDQRFAVSPCRDGPFEAGAPAFRKRPQSVMSRDDAYTAFQGACACKTNWWFWRAPALFPKARFFAKIEDDSIVHDSRLAAELISLPLPSPVRPVWFSQFQWAGMSPSSLHNGWFCGDGDEHMASLGPGKAAAEPCHPPGVSSALSQLAKVSKAWGRERFVYPFASGGLDVRSGALVAALGDCGDAMRYAREWSASGAHCGCSESRLHCDPDDWAAACDGIQGFFVARCMRVMRLQNVSAFHLTLRKFSHTARPTRDTTVMHPYKGDTEFGKGRRGAWNWQTGPAMQPLEFTLFATAAGVGWEAANPAAVARWYEADTTRVAWSRACDGAAGVRCGSVPPEREAAFSVHTIT